MQAASTYDKINNSKDTQEKGRNWGKETQGKEVWQKNSGEGTQGKELKRKNSGEENQEKELRHRN